MKFPINIALLTRKRVKTPQTSRARSFRGQSFSTHVVMSAEQIDVLLADGVVEILEVSCRRKPARLSHLRVRGQAVVSAPVYYRSHAIAVEV